jgi:hypothetical protein
MVGDLTPEQLAALEEDANDPESGIAAQQAKAEAGNVDDSTNPAPCDTSDEAIRARGGYMLNDPQWVAGGPWNGLPASEQQGEQNRRFDIVERMKSGTAFGFTADFSSLDPFGTDLAGYFPASQAGAQNLRAHDGDEARIAYSITTGNDLATCKADPAFYVSSIADAT